MGELIDLSAAFRGERSAEDWKRMIDRRAMRLVKLVYLDAPDIIVNKETELLQNAVEGLLECRKKEPAPEVSPE